MQNTWNRFKNNAIAIGVLLAILTALGAITQYAVINPIHQQFDATNQQFDAINRLCTKSSTFPRLFVQDGFLHKNPHGYKALIPSTHIHECSPASFLDYMEVPVPSCCYFTRTARFQRFSAVLHFSGIFQKMSDNQSRFQAAFMSDLPIRVWRHSYAARKAARKEKL